MGRCSFGESEGSVVGTDLEVLLYGGLDDIPARLARASSAGISPRTHFSPLRHISHSPILQSRSLRPGKFPNIPPVLSQQDGNTVLVRVRVMRTMKAFLYLWFETVSNQWDKSALLPLSFLM